MQSKASQGRIRLKFQYTNIRALIQTADSKRFTRRHSGVSCDINLLLHGCNFNVPTRARGKGTFFSRY